MTLCAIIIDEPGVDEGGPRREWFGLVVERMLGVEFGLFVQAKESKVFFPCTNSEAVPDSLILFKFLGLLVGKAFIENI